jgi:UDP-N-acetylmuramoylalanine--D-glutamate ligase
MNAELRGDSFLIVGFGREGRSVFSFLRERFPTTRIGIADRQQIDPNFSHGPHTEIYSGDDYLANANSFATVIRSPGVRLQEIAQHITSANHVTSATNIFFAERKGRVIGVTGTKGKSTTASLIASILSHAFPDTRLVGNIGAPMLDHLAGAAPETHFVIELSSYQLEDLRISPNIAVLLNIVPEHLDYHGGFEAYRAAKSSITRHQSPNDILIYNPSFPVLGPAAQGSQAKRLFFCEQDNASSLVSFRDGNIILATDGEAREVVEVAELPLLGPGNLQNTLAAIACAAALKVPIEVIRTGLRSFKPLEHRLEFVGEQRGVRFYNDSLSTIPEALNHAIAALGPDVETLIAGGFDRGVDMSSVGPVISSSGVKTLILFPTTGEKIWSAVKRAQPATTIRRLDAHTMEEAVRAAYTHTSRGKICVMSPAASSFSVFRDYKERGDKFKEAVRAVGRSGDLGS